MSTFAVKVCSLTIEPHPNADQIELAKIGDYLSIVKKGQFKTGDLGVYIPEGAIVPHLILEKLGLIDKLAGKEKNRVKAIKLRGILSQGIVYPVCQLDDRFYIEIPTDSQEGINKILHVYHGMDVSEDLGIIKYEPPVPTELNGLVYNAGSDKCIKYDIENIKAYPDAFYKNEPVVITEKIHGTFAQFGYIPGEPKLVVSSKGLAAKGFAIEWTDENKNNVYLRVATSYHVYNSIVATFGGAKSVFVLGEIFGKKVQDLTYNSLILGFRVFDIYLGEPGKGRYLNDNELTEACSEMVLTRVPVLYRGGYSKDVVKQYTSGKETVSGEESHIREGIVIKPQIERYDYELGRVILKSVSEEYLLRKGGTEFN